MTHSNKYLARPYQAQPARQSIFTTSLLRAIAGSNYFLNSALSRSNSRTAKLVTDHSVLLLFGFFLFALSPHRIEAQCTWASVSSGGDHSAAIKSDGSLWAWGDNGYGQLGDGTSVKSSVPVRIGNGNNWKLVSCGDRHTVAIKSDGSLWAWGDNSYDQIGDGSNTTRKTPTKIGDSNDWKSVSCGSLHTVALKNNATMWAWGRNDTGALGDGSYKNKNIPIKIGDEQNWESVSCGGYHTVGIKTDASLWAWGYNIDGALGDGTSTEKNIPVRIGSGEDWKFVSCGWTHTAALKTDGSLWAWGRNGSGQLGDSTNINKYIPTKIGSAADWRTVSCGFSHSIASKTDGTLWVWGYNEDGQLGDGSGVPVNTPRKLGSTNDWQRHSCGANHTAAIKSDGTLWAWGKNSNGQVFSDNWEPKAVDSRTDWNFVAGGWINSTAIKDDGSLWAWGYGGTGKLGNGTYASKSTPTRLGNEMDWKTFSCQESHTLALKSNGTLWAWGANDEGQLGDGTNDYQNIPVNIGNATDWKSVNCGRWHSAAIKTDGTLWSWGGNQNGQLGSGTNIGRSIPEKIDSATDWNTVSCGYLHTIAIKNDGSLWSWGANFSGQLGDGTENDRFIPVKISSVVGWKSVSCNFSTSYAIKNDGSLWAWGGLISDVPTKVGTESNWKSVSNGGSHRVAIKTDGTLWAWGRNSDGQLGDGTYVDKNIPTKIGSLNNWNIANCGDSHTVAIKSDGSLWSWGRNDYGQLGSGVLPPKLYCGCLSSNPPAAIISSKPGNQICNGEIITLTAQPEGLRYLWSTGETSQTIEVSPSSTTSYQVSVTCAGSTFVDVRSVVVTLNAAPTVPTQPNDNVSFCQVDVQNGTSIISATPPAGATISWYSTASGGVPISTGSNTLLHTNTVPNAYTYFAESELASGQCKSTSRKRITVTIKPTPTMIPTADKFFCAGDAVNLTFASSPTGSVFNWQNNNTKTGLLKTNDVGNISFTAAANNSPNSETSTIKVTPTLNQCSGAEIEYLLTLKPTPQLVSIDSFARCSGTLFDLPNFAINPVISGTQNYSWKNSNPAIGLSSGAGGQIPNFTPNFNATGNNINGTITYTVTVTGCASAPKSYQVTVFPQPQLSFNIVENADKNPNDVTLPDDAKICENDKIILQSIVTKSPQPYEYAWSPNFSTSSTLVANPAVTTSFSVVVTDSNTCTNNISKLITVNKYPLVNISVNETSGLSNFDEKICSKDEVKLTANESNGSSGVYSFAWNTNNFTTKTITNNPVTPPNQNYIVSVTNSGCQKVETKSIDVFGLPTPAISNQNVGGKILPDKDAFFKDASIPFAGSTLVTWLWNFQNGSPSPQTIQNPNPVKFTKTGSQTVSLKVTDSNGCMNTSDKPFTVNPACDGQFQDFPVGPFCLIKDSSILLSFKIRLGQYSSSLNGDWNALPPGVEWVEKPLINASLVNMTKDAKLKVTKSGLYEIGFFYTDPLNPICQNELITQSFIVNAAPTALVTFDKTKANYCQGDTVGVLVKLSGKAPFTYSLSNTAVITSPIDSVRTFLLTNDITKFKDKNLGFSVVTLKDDNTCVAKEVNSVVATDSVLIHSLPEFLNYTAGCSSDNNKFAVSFDIGAGKSPFTFVSDSITKNLLKAGNVAARQFSSDSIATKIGGNPFIITITDVLGCKATKIDTSKCQAGCDTARGTFLPSTLEACEGANVNITVQNSPATGPKVIKDFILVKDNDWDIDKLKTQFPNPILILHRWKDTLRYNEIVGKINLDELYHIYEIYGGDATGFMNLDEACLKITERGRPIIFHRTPTIQTIKFAKDKICNKDEVFLKFNFSGKAPFTFKLDSFNSSSKLNSLVDSLVIRRADYKDKSGPFKISVAEIISDGNGCPNKAPKASATVTVNPLPAITAISDLTFCKNQKNETITVTHIELIPKRLYSYNWIFSKADSTKINYKNEKTKTVVIDLLNDNVKDIPFRVEVKDSLNGCLDSTSKVILVNNKSAPPFDSIFLLKSDSSFLYIFPNSSLCYFWQINENGVRKKAPCRNGINDIHYCELTQASDIELEIWNCDYPGCSRIYTAVRSGDFVPDRRPFYSLYPNPTAGTLQLEIQNGILGAYRVQFTDLIGRVVYVRSITTRHPDDRFEFDLEGWSNGAYFMTIADPEGRKWTRKVIKVE